MAQTYVWRYRTHATDCTALTDGKVTDLCYEQDSQKLYKCVPDAGDCTGTEWKQTSSFLTGDDTQVLFFDGANNPIGEDGFKYIKGSDLAKILGGIQVSDGTDKSITAITIDRESTDATIAWDEVNEEFDFNYPINAGGTSNSLVFSNGVEISNPSSGVFNFYDGTNSAQQWNLNSEIDGDAIANDTLKSNDINWQSLQDVQSADINWTNVKDEQAIYSSAINWQSLEEIQSADINWTNIKDSQSVSSSAINWQNLEELANGNINWSTVNLGSTFAMPSGTNPTIDGAGEIAIDTTSDHIEYYGGAKRVFGYQRQFCFALEDPVDADDDVPIYFPREPITVTDVYCEVDGGTSVALTISDGTNALEAITCDADGAEDDGSIANGTFTANERMEIDLASSSGTNTWLVGCITYTLTED